MDYGIGTLFSDFSIAINGGIFVVLAVCIWAAGTRLSYVIDAVAEKTKMARALLGLILLATATELPEVATTLTASSTGKGTLALNNMFGGMMLQLAVLAFADMFVKGGRNLSSMPRHATVTMAGLLCVLSLSLLLIISGIGDFTFIFHLGLGATLVGVLYVVSMALLERKQRHDIWSPVDLPDDKTEEETRHNRFDRYAMRRLCLQAVLCALVILASGYLIVHLADTLATQTGLGQSFVGVSLLALTTSLPELSTSIAAVRVKAYTMAISNIFGSNMIMTFLVFPVDLAYTDGAVLNSIGPSAEFALGAGIFMTTLYCIGLLMRPKIRVWRMGIDSALVLVCYIGSLGALYMLR